MLLSSLFLVLQSSSWAHGGSKVEPNCGISGLPGSRDDRTVTATKATEARESEYPWQVSIQTKKDSYHYCGGSVIAPDIILTAAHCVDGYFPGDLSIEAGLLDLSKPSKYDQTRSVSRVITHESYGSGRNDIALIKLDAPFDLAASAGHIGPVCLPSQEYTLEDNVTITGWGTVFASGPSSMKLLTVTVPVQGDITCRTKGTNFYNSTIMFCAGIPAGEFCPGDSGGPAVQRKDGLFTLVSVLSFGWGYGCLLGFYPKVSAHRPWIVQRMAELHSN